MKKPKLTSPELEEKLDHNIQNLNDTQILSLIGSWNWNIKTNETEWSDMMFMLLGLAPNELPPTYELALHHIHKEDKENYERVLGNAVSEKKPFFLENRIIKKDGSVISVLSRGMCFLDEEGNLNRMIGTVQDITEIKKKENTLEQQQKTISNYSLDLEKEIKSRTQKLRESETKLLQAQHTAKVGTWEWDLKTDKMKWSNQMYENFGLEKDSLVTIDEFFKYVHPNDIEYINEKVAETRNDGTSHQVVKYRIITPKGEVRFVHGISEKILDESGNIFKMLGTVQDITDIEKAEHLQSQVEAVLQGQEMERERIAADLHDSINPLLSIASLNLESLLDFTKNDQDNRTEKLEKTITILENVIKGIREISQNLSPAVLKNFGLEKALEQLCNSVRETGKLEFDFKSFGLDKRLVPKIEVALYRIGQELINNILKHADASNVDIQLVRHNKSIIMMVSDNGEGFDESSLPNLKTNGFGFKNIKYRVSSLNGDLNIDSSKGKGTTVTIELPV